MKLKRYNRIKRRLNKMANMIIDIIKRYNPDYYDIQKKDATN